MRRGAAGKGAAAASAAGRTALVCALSLACAACMHWRPAPGSVREAFALGPRAEVRLTRADGFSIVLRRPALVADSISGLEPRSGARRTVAADVVRSVEVRRFDGQRTLGVVAAWVLLAALTDARSP